MVVAVPLAESVPDGSIWYPHHFVIGAWGLMFVSWLLTLDGDRPIVTVGGLLVAMYGWYHIWPSLPLTGSLVVLTGLLITTFALTRKFWYTQADHRKRVERAAAVFLIIAWDDTISHAFGVYTPLDHVWAVLLHPTLI